MNKKQFALTLICTVVFAFVGGAVSNALFHGSAVMAQKPVLFGGGNQFRLPEGQFIGLVQKGKLKFIVPNRPIALPIRLTRIQMQEARPADSEEINLKEYEGKVIMFSGHDGGTWIYRAEIIDSGGPLLAALAQKVFGKPGPVLVR